MADRVQLQQVMLNLLMNAAEATASSSNRERLVCVRSEKHDADWVRISVEDSGTGIKPEDEKADLRGLLYDEGRWNGDGAIDLPVDRRIAWRPHNGSKGNAARIGLPSHLAGRQDVVLPP